MFKPLLAAALVIVLAGCVTPPPATAPVTAPVVGTPPAAEPSSWIGRWHAPDGRFVQIMPTAQPDTYQLVFGDADGRETRVAGMASAGRLYFSRAGSALALHAGTGTETGFPALADQRQCVVVKPGPEGYCRTPDSADALPLVKGAYVPVAADCWAPPAASLVYFDGLALISPQTLACRTPIVDQTGVIFSVESRCGTADGVQPARRQQVTVADAQRFALTDADGATELYRYCPAAPLPAGMSELAR